MKSFNQFLNECYLSEEEVQGRLLTNRGTAQNLTNPRRTPFIGTDPTPTPASRRLPAGSPEGPRTSPGQMEIPGLKTTKVPGSKVRGGSTGSTPSSSPTEALPSETKGAPLARRTSRIPGTPDAMVRGAQDAANKPPATPKPPASTPSPTTNPSSSAGKPPALSSTNARRASAEAKKAAAAAGSGPSGKVTPMSGSSGASSAAKQLEKSAAKGAEKVAAKTATKTVGKGILGKIAGPASAALDTALSTADERSKGSGWARSLAKGATVAAGGLLGGTAGAIGGGGVLSAATGTAGALAGGAAAEKAFDVAAGANAKQRKQIATANRKSQSGGAIKGIGGPTSFDTKKNTITSGGKTAQLGKTSVVTNPKTGKQEVGNLAYKNGQAVYKRSDTKSLAQTSSNPLERIGRTMFAGAYKKSDAANAAAKLNQARQSDSARNKALGVKMLPGK
jgi:hypothetical protein